MPKKILFVCTGNTCRSPLAEGLLRNMASQKGWDLEAQSAGLAAFNGVPAAPEAVEAGREKGLDLSGHQSQPLSKALVMESDLIVTMTGKHKEIILKKMPQLDGKVVQLSELAGDDPVDVEDPVGQGIEVYRTVLAQMEAFLLKSSDRLNSVQNKG